MSQEPKILSTSELLREYKNKLTLPDFQRDYVWKADQWGQLWEDLIHLADDGQHFMGSLTLQADNIGFRILDGQQRLTTLMVLLDFLTAQQGRLDPQLGNLFCANDSANVQYLDLLNPENTAGHKTRASAQCIQYRNIFQYFATRYSLAGHPGRAALLNKLKFRFFWLVTEIPSGSALGHQTFELLNATGKPLAYADFLLGYLLELAEQKQDLTGKEVKERWRALLGSLTAGELYVVEEPKILDTDTPEPDAGEAASSPDSSAETGASTNDTSSSRQREETFQPLKLKKYLNALQTVARLWEGSIPETVESFQDVLSLLCNTAPQDLTANCILTELEAWLPYYLALTNPLSTTYEKECFEQERYYLSTLRTAAVPMAMRVLRGWEKGRFSSRDVAAILGAAVRFSLYLRIYVSRVGSGLQNVRQKLAMLDYILAALQLPKDTLTVSQVLGILMGGTEWKLTEAPLRTFSYSSSVSKVLLCIAYHRDGRQPSIAEWERQNSQPFQVEHMVARNLQGGEFSKYGFDVSTIDQPANLLLLEQSLNNTLNNLPPEEKLAREDGWKRSCLFNYYQQLSTFPDGPDHWPALYTCQKRRMQDLWDGFRDYMGTPQKIEQKPAPILWVHKNAGRVQKLEPCTDGLPGRTPSRNLLLYSLNSDLQLQTEPKREKELERVYLCTTRSDTIYYMDSEGLHKSDGQLLSHEGAMMNTDPSIKNLAALFLRFLIAEEAGVPPISTALGNLLKEEPLYGMLAFQPVGTEKPNLQEHCDDQNVAWNPISLAELIQSPQECGTVWLNPKFSGPEFSRRLHIFYQRYQQISPSNRFGFWVETKTPTLQLLGQEDEQEMYYVPYLNIGDEDLYREFLEQSCKGSARQKTTPPLLTNSFSRWFRAERKSLIDLLQLPLQIPEYQRTYVWNRQNRLELLNRLLNAPMEKGDIDCGIVILCRSTASGFYDLVDGQQRLTTLDAFCQYAMTFCSKDLPLKSEIVNFPEEVGIDQKRRLAACLKRVHFTVLYLEGEDLPIICPYQVFSAINGKGKKLTTSEKLKNLLFEKLESNTLGCKKKEVADLLRDTRFPKAWVEKNHKCHISDEELYRVCKNDLAASDKLKDFLACGEIYKRYFNSIPNDASPALKTELLFYRSLEITTGDALLLSWLCEQNRVETGDVTRKLKKLNMLYFLLYVMDRNGNDKKSINGKLPKLVGCNTDPAIRCNEQTLLNEALTTQTDPKIVWDQYVTTYDYGNARKAVARFLLLQIERWLGLPEDDLQRYLAGQKSDLVEVEHIHPISTPDASLRMNSLENICLLEKSINISVSDLPLEGKLHPAEQSRHCYKDSRLKMPAMFYADPQKSIARWYSPNSKHYEKAGAEARSEELWKMVGSAFAEALQSILPSA